MSTHAQLLLAALTLAVSGCALQRTPTGYRLERSFGDFYDTALVLTEAGAARPRVVSVRGLAAALAPYDVVVYGESHGHPGVHLEQMQLLRALYARSPNWILSLEQFERDVQGTLDDYLVGSIGETTLIDRGRAWKNYASSYRPLLLFAKDHHLPVVAAEAPDWTIACIAQVGPTVLAQFAPAERAWVALDVEVPSTGAYRDKFLGFIGGSTTHGAAPGTPDAAALAERSFAAQIARDGTMAESIVKARRTHPGYRVLHLTGSFHSDAFLGTVERLRSLDPALKVAVIEPLEVDDPRAPGFAADDLKRGTALQLIYPNPDEFAPGEDMSAFTEKMHHERAATHCKYAPPEPHRITPPPPAVP